MLPMSLCRTALATAGAVLAIAGASAAASTHTTKTCKPLPKYPGTGYFTSLKVTGVSCATGKKVMLAYYKCRIKNGVAGTCKTKVLGYTCKEVRNTIPVEFDARVTCTNGSKKVVHTYQQDT